MGAVVNWPQCIDLNTVPWKADFTISLRLVILMEYTTNLFQMDKYDWMSSLSV